MKLDYVFKQYDYVVCKDLTEEQIQSLVDRMVECGARLYEGSDDYFEDGSNTLAWDADGDTYFLAEENWSEDKDYTEVRWEDIVKESKPKSLREMFPNGMYTDNSEEVFKRFKELLEGDYNEDDKREYNKSSLRCGLDRDYGNMLAQYGSYSYGLGSTYLTNEEFFAIKLGDTTSSEAPEEYVTVADVQEPTIGYLIEQIQLNTAPNSPEVIIGKDGSVVVLYGLDLEINVSGKSADEIDKIYQALSTLMDA